MGDTRFVGGLVAGSSLQKQPRGHNIGGGVVGDNNGDTVGEDSFAGDRVHWRGDLLFR